jgi:superfamily II DNA/RNA helicase
MTVVQEQSCPVALTGVDVLAKAKTGTGKTIRYYSYLYKRNKPSVSSSLPFESALKSGQIKV